MRCSLCRCETGILIGGMCLQCRCQHDRREKDSDGDIVCLDCSKILSSRPRAIDS